MRDSEVRTIVVALDGSDVSRACLPTAVSWARTFGARIVLAHVEQFLAARGSGPLLADENRVEGELRELAAQLNAADVPASVRWTVARTDGPAEGIAEIAAEANADVIVVGTRGNGPIASLVLGSCTQRLLEIAGRPVLAIPPARREASAN